MRLGVKITVAALAAALSATAMSTPANAAVKDGYCASSSEFCMYKGSGLTDWNFDTNSRIAWYSTERFPQGGWSGSANDTPNDNTKSVLNNMGGQIKIFSDGCYNGPAYVLNTGQLNFSTYWSNRISSHGPTNVGSC